MEYTAKRMKADAQSAERTAKRERVVEGMERIAKRMKSDAESAQRERPDVRDVWLTVAEGRVVKGFVQWDGSGGLYSVHDILNTLYRDDLREYVDPKFAPRAEAVLDQDGEG
jgi:hypothetical protein